MMLLRVSLFLGTLLVASVAWAQAVPKTTTPPPAVPKTTTQTPPPATVPKATTLATPPAVPALQIGGVLPTSVVALLDAEYVLANSAASKAIRTQLEAIRDIFSAEISQKEERLRTQDQELRRQQAILSPEAFAVRRRAFDADVDAAQRLVEERNRQIDVAFSVAMDKVEAAILRVLEDLAPQRGFNVVLDKRNALFHLVGLDLTAEVITLLDRRLPRVEVPLPGKP